MIECKKFIHKTLIFGFIFLGSLSWDEADAVPRSRVLRRSVASSSSEGGQFPTAARAGSKGVSESLDLEGFLNQVKTKNSGVRGGFISSEAAMDRADEGKLLLSYTGFVRTSYTREAKLYAPLFVFYDAQETKVLSLGVSKLFDFGMQAELRYDMASFGYINPMPAFQVPGMASIIPLSIATASTNFEITQNLWQNGFGAGTQAQQTLLEAQALSAGYAARFQAKASLTEAEANYWRLSAAHQIVRVQEDALDRAQKIYEWNLRRNKMHLNEESDLLQSEALYQARQLELAAAKNEVRSASRAFNTSRNVNSDYVEETLTPMSPELTLKLEPPQRVEIRDDVKAAKEGARASVAAAESALQKDSPAFDVFARVALNGQQGNTIFANLSDAIPPSFSLNRPTTTVGLRFSAPLDFSLLGAVREGWRREKVAAELKFDQKLFEQEQSWKNLNETLVETKQNLEMALNLERIQSAKLTNERTRLQNGRTTTYQVLLFEQDFLNAELNRIRSQLRVLGLVAQLKLFGETL